MKAGKIKEKTQIESAPEPDSLPAWLKVAAFAGRCLGPDQPKKKPWAWGPGLT